MHFYTLVPSSIYLKTCIPFEIPYIHADLYKRDWEKFDNFLKYYLKNRIQSLFLQQKKIHLRFYTLASSNIHLKTGIQFEIAYIHADLPERDWEKFD